MIFLLENNSVARNSSQFQECLIFSFFVIIAQFDATEFRLETLVLILFLEFYDNLILSIIILALSNK